MKKPYSKGPYIAYGVRHFCLGGSHKGPDLPPTWNIQKHWTKYMKQEFSNHWTFGNEGQWSLRDRKEMRWTWQSLPLIPVSFQVLVQGMGIQAGPWWCPEFRRQRVQGNLGRWTQGTVPQKRATQGEKPRDLWGVWLATACEESTQGRCKYCQKRLSNSVWCSFRAGNGTYSPQAHWEAQNLWGIG